MKMPAPDEATLAKRAEIAAALRRVVPDGVIDSATELKTFESDGLTAYRQPPMLAVLPADAAQVAAALKVCGDMGVRVVPRGAGTGLSGGATPVVRRAGHLLFTRGTGIYAVGLDLARLKPTVHPHFA